MHVCDCVLHNIQLSCLPESVGLAPRPCLCSYMYVCVTQSQLSFLPEPSDSVHFDRVCVCVCLCN